MITFKMRSLLIPLLVTVVSLIGCQQAKIDNLQNFEVLYKIDKLNGKEFILEISFKNRSNGKVRLYKPPADNENSAEMGVLYYREIISPSGVWLFLPRGKFSGFVFVKAESLDDFLDQQVGTNFTVKSKNNGPKLVYEFIEWVKDDQVRVKFGLSGKMHEIVIDLSESKVIENKDRIEVNRFSFINFDRRE